MRRFAGKPRNERPWGLVPSFQGYRLFLNSSSCSGFPWLAFSLSGFSVPESPFSEFSVSESSPSFGSHVPVFSVSTLIFLHPCSIGPLGGLETVVRLPIPSERRNPEVLLYKSKRRLYRGNFIVWETTGDDVQIG